MSTRTENDVIEYPCGGPIRAEVQVRAGVITVVAEERTTAQVRVAAYDDGDASHAAAAETTVHFDNDRLRIETPDRESAGWLMRRSGRVRIDLRIPAGSHLAAYAGSADVHVSGRLGGATIRSGSGDAFVGQVTGDLTVDSGRGDVRAEGVGGAFGVKTGSGDVFVTSAGGPVTAQVASGDVHIEEAVGPVQVSTASGDVHLGAAIGGQVQVKAASGDVTVGVPVGTKVWLDLSTLSGSTSTDLAVTGTPPEGGATLNLRVHTLSGDIRVHRVSRPATAWPTGTSEAEPHPEPAPDPDE